MMYRMLALKTCTILHIFTKASCVSINLGRGHSLPSYWESIGQREGLNRTV